MESIKKASMGALGRLLLIFLQVFPPSVVLKRCPAVLKPENPAKAVSESLRSGTMAIGERAGNPAASARIHRGIESSERDSFTVVLHTALAPFKRLPAHSIGLPCESRTPKATASISP